MLWEVVCVWFLEEIVALLILDMFKVSPCELAVSVVSVLVLTAETSLGWVSAVPSERLGISDDKVLTEDEDKLGPVVGGRTLRSVFTIAGL